MAFNFIKFVKYCQIDLMKERLLGFLISGKRLCGIIFMLHFTCTAIDLTINITSIPPNTPVNDNIFISGNFNNWSLGNAQYIMQLQPNGQRSIVLQNVSGIIEFKFNRGSWATVEATAQGGFLPNRTYNTANGNVLNLSIAGWEDLTGNASSTANANVQILSNSFFIPELNRNRRIWLYLPNDYLSAPEKRYPVIYMHDGQNLFDQATSFSGEWQVDEALHSLQNQGDYGAIVVGIDNGGSNRINEYSPWINAQYGGGQGDLYIDFIKNTLKPYIDNNYRTLSQAQNTGLIGSSMGGLISLYGASKFPNVFGKAGIFSPSIWFARQQVSEFISSQSFNGIPFRVYFVGGTNESSSMLPDMQSAKTALINAGVIAQEVRLVSHNDGAHSEWYWRREFPAAYQYLFPQPFLPTSISEEEEVEWQLFPNPAKDSFEIRCNTCNNFVYRIISADGRFIEQRQVNAKHSIIVISGFAEGAYIIQIESDTHIYNRKLLIQR
jgi:predicted alpha/beta superfamily hydrolase